MQNPIVFLKESFPMCPMWFKPSDAETTVDYRYTYDGQKPHAVSSITDGVTETLHTFTYDASGNNLLETNSKASSDRQMVWTEDNRLASIKARGNINHYLYDANGIRTLKMSSSSFNISVNGVAAGSSAVDGNFTIYANPYAVVRKNQYTKHYFLGTQRILTKIGNSEVEKTFFEGYAENIVPNVDYQGKQDDLENKLVLNNELLNVGWYRETRGRIPSQHIKHYLRSKEYGGQSGVNPWGNSDSDSSDNNQSQNAEDKQYYFHPDHLGSTNYLTDVAGEAYQHVAYLPWGEVFVEQRNTQSSRNTFLYTGKELDEETGLQYFGFRYLDNKKGTFLNVDPLMDFAPHLSSYRYAFNNPIVYYDPNGLFESKSEAKQWAKDNNIRTGFMRRHKIEKGADGTWEINNRKDNISYFKDESLKEYDIIGRGNDGVISSALSLGKSYNHFSAMSSDAWNSPIARHFVPDLISFSFSSSATAFVGFNKDISFNWITRGHDAKLAPYVVMSIGAQGGPKVVADALINFKVGYYIAADMRSLEKNQARDGLLKWEAYGSVDAGSGFGGSIGGSVGFQDLPFISAPTWVTGGVGFGASIGAGSAFGVSYSWPVIHNQFKK